MKISTSNYTSIFVRYSKSFRNEKKNIVEPTARNLPQEIRTIFAESGVEIKLLQLSFT